MPTIDSYASANDYLGSKVNRPAPHGNAVRIVRDLVRNGAATISVVYHKTPIVTYIESGDILIWGNGWATRTTCAHIAEYLPFSVRLSPVRRDVGQSPSSKRMVYGGRSYIGQDRAGHGDTFLVSTIGRIPNHVMHAFGASELVHVSRNGVWTNVHLPSWFPTYDCTCKMCRTGASSWQQTA